jgi:hypothetical protein
MRKVASRLLLIDASIVRAAGNSEESPSSKYCRDFLVTVRRV